ncbi:MAG: cbb3-type cytochrome c oxidase subunit 3 [Proteobacteria bacterium]|nr:cbb3-type cytochrome c oxidase subunit 3 [Pseudomonadota bacterium]
MTYETIVGVAATGGLIYFVLLFAIVIAFVFWPRNAEKFRDAANIPLKED